jgi:imidazolonepropionase-like amidohydrolase
MARSYPARGARSAACYGSRARPEYALLVLSTALWLLAADAAAPPARAADVALLHATLLPVSGPPIEDGTLVLRDGRIAAIGAGLPAPAGATVVDATGRYVTPGLLDPHSHMGVYPWPEASAHGDGNEAVEPFTPRVWAGDAFDAEDPAIPRARAGGITTIQVLPGSANLIGGRSAVLKLRRSLDVKALELQGAPPGIKMAVGENPKRVYANSDGDEEIDTRMGEFAAFRRVFQAALDYRAARARKEPPPRDLDLEVLLDVIDDKIRVNLHCYRTHDILAFLRVAEEFGFRVSAFHHALEAYKVRDAIARHGASVVTFTDWWGFKMEAWDAIPQNAPLTASAGVNVSLHSDSANHIQRMNLEAAKMLRYGWSEQQALASVTLNPARVLGIEGRVGTLEVGKDADVVLWERHPLDVYTHALRTWVDGVVVYDRATEGVPNGVR